MADDDTFLSRWSKRKVQAKQAVPATAEVAPASTAPPPRPAGATPISLVVPRAPGAVAPVAPLAADAATAALDPGRASGPVGAEPGRAPDAPEATQAAAPPTLGDVAELSKDSDYSRFVASGVDPDVKNAAMKKLFASDPHFNQMDGLDVYIDDYNRFEPIPRNLLRQLVNARAMGLLDDELPEQPDPHNPSPAHEDSDLQLQPHDAAGQPGAEPGVADSADRSDGPAPGSVPPPSA